MNDTAPTDFETILSGIGDTSILGRPKLEVIYKYLLRARSLPGDTAELGVYKGGTALFISVVLPEKTLHLFDTFTGLPAVSEHDWHKEGEFADTSLNTVRSLFQDVDGTVFYVGFFPATVDAEVSEKKFCFVHCDGDLYQSTVAFLNFFYPRMVPGGIMIFDDYRWPHCPGVERALSEFLKGKPEQVVIEQEFQAIVIKEPYSWS